MASKLPQCDRWLLAMKLSADGLKAIYQFASCAEKVTVSVDLIVGPRIGQKQQLVSKVFLSPFYAYSCTLLSQVA